MSNENPYSSENQPRPEGEQPEPQTPPPGEPGSIPGGETPPPGPGPEPAIGPTIEAAPTQEERTWAMVAHLGTLIIFLGIPFGNILVPLVIWLIKKDQMPFVADQAKESLNFQITATIAGLISSLLIFICIGIVLVAAVVIAAVVLAIIAGLAANRGERYRYPWTLRLVS